MFFVCARFDGWGKLKPKNPLLHETFITLPAILAATVVVLCFPFLRGEGMYFLYLTAIVCCSLYGSVRAGIAATVLSLALCFFISYQFDQSPNRLIELFVLIAFGLASALTVFLCYARKKSERARLEAENKYRVLFEDAITGIYETTVDGHYVAANPKLAEMFGYASAGEMLEEAENLNRKFYVEAGRREEFMRLVRENGNLAAFESEIFRRDGSKIWISENALAVRGQAGKLAGFQGTTIDITNRKIAEAALQKAREELEQKVAERTAELTQVNDDLRESEEKFRSLVEVISDCVWEADERGVYTFISAKVKEVIGYEPEEIIGKTPYDLMTADDARRVIDYLKPIVAARKNFVFMESVQLHKSGESVVTETSGVPVFDAAGGYCGYRGVVRDISERRRAAGQLEASEKRYRELVENARDMIYTVDFNGRYTSLNRAGKEFVGMTDEKVRQMTAADIVPVEYHPLIEQKIQEKIAGKEQTIYEIEIIVNNRRVPVELNSWLIYDENGKPFASQGIARDITERRQAEAALRESELRLGTVVTAAPVILFAVDRAGIFTLSEGKGLEPLGLKAGAVVGKSVFELYKDVPPIVQDIKQALAGESFINNIQIADLIYESRYTPLFDERGAVSGVIGVSIDITERKRKENELRASQKQLRELSAHLQSVREEERKNLARELHDEFGQQLTALKIELVRLDEKISKSFKKSAAGWIAEGFAATLDVVDLAMETTRKIVAELRPGILDELGLAAAMEWQTGEFQKRTGVICELYIEFDEADACQNLKTTVFRILQECLTNIARHAGATKAKITLRDEGWRIFFEIEDDGRGFDDDFAKACSVSSFGLLGIRERALLLKGTVETGAGKLGGARVTVLIPRPVAVE